MNNNSIKLSIAFALGLSAMSVQADSAFYSTLSIGLENTDTGGTSNAEFKSLSSWFGFQSEAELENDMSAFGRFEVELNTEQADEDVVDLRFGNIGLKGGFGKLTIGQDYHTFYNFAVGPADIPWWGSGWATQSYTGRTDQGLTYVGGTDVFNIGITTYLDTAGEDDLDGTEVGASFGIGEMTLGIAVQDLESETDSVTGLLLSGIQAGGMTLGIGFQNKDDDNSYLIDAVIGNAYIHYEALDQDVGASPTSITLGYTHTLGEKARAWFEFQSVDADTSNSDDDETYFRAFLSYDIL